MAQYTQQEKDLIYALDIGTRSVIGIVGRMEGERFKVLAVDQEEHGKRAMSGWLAWLGLLPAGWRASWESV